MKKGNVIGWVVGVAAAAAATYAVVYWGGKAWKNSQK